MHMPKAKSLTEAGDILFLRILYPIHIQAPKKDIISYHYHGKKKEMATHCRNGRNGSAKGKILLLKPKILGTER
jgi:hypothetical protein